MDYRFWDKAHLSSYSLDTKIFDEFNFSVSDASPVRSVFLLTTNEGFKILKKINYTVDELMFIYTSLEQVRHEYPYIVQFKQTKKRLPYLEYDGDTYVVLDLIEGRECIFENQIDLANIGTALAQFHSAASKADLSNHIRNNSYKMVANFKHMIRNMESFVKIARMHVNRSDFDKLYLENYDYHRELAKSALDILVKSPYRSLFATKKTLCHHDLAHHNIIIGCDEKIYFIDFDYMIIDLPYHDLSNLIRKAAKVNGWSTEAYDHIINSYAAYSGFTADEEQVLYAYLRFPYDFYSVSNFYYSKIKTWEEEEYLEKLIKKVSFKEQKAELIGYIGEKLSGFAESN